MPPETLILSLSLAAGLYMAWNIGANDVANAMGTSLASGALTMRRAVIIAAVANLLGAILAGASVTSTISKGVVDTRIFEDQAEVFVLGMLSVILGASIWVMFATYRGLPVSTTHAIVGAVLGFGLFAGGVGGIRWGVVMAIVASWVISPVVGALISFSVFWLIRRLILNQHDAVGAAVRVGPWFAGMVLGVLTLATIYKGLKNLHLHLSFLESLGIALAAAVVGGLLARVVLIRLRARLPDGYETVEDMAKPLQILSASYESFAHGANDVANAVGPLAAILTVLKHGSVAAKVEVPIWVLIIGGVGLAVGIATWGHRVMGTIGKKITEITPSRGFAAEFGTATTVLICSRLGLPVSTTHTSVGNVIGVGLARGISGINLRVLGSILYSWVLTLPVAGLLAALLFMGLRALLL